MPDLTQTLHDADLSLLRMIAGSWGLDLAAPDVHTALPMLAEALHDAELVQEILDVLPQEALLGLQALLENENRMTWAMFTRRFGEVRSMGPGKRERERPDLKPASNAEILWYRALIGRAFLHFPPAEPQEYAYIPDDLLDYLKPLATHMPPLLGRPASPGESGHEILANDRILDHACTLLAALRLGLKTGEVDDSQWNVSAPILASLLQCAGLVDPALQPQPEPVRAFLEGSRGAALALLSQAWMNSLEFNDLRYLGGLKFEGEWENDPLRARRAILDLLSQVTPGQWWSLAAFTAGVKERHADFQRPAGDYDSWFIRRTGDDTYLRGFGCWDEVDGALVRFYITGPLHWLGIFDLAAPSTQSAPAAFRFTAKANDLWQGIAPAGEVEEIEQLKVSSDGRMRVPRLVPRSARYLIARFCLWESEKEGEYLYRLIPSSLERARQQGLRAAHLVALLRKYSSNPVPPILVQALERWDKNGAQANMSRTTVLQVASPEILAALRKTRAGRFMGEQLNPTTITIRPGGEETVQAALAEIGYLMDG
ncbi:MAG TPA: helicase-associated domain-containing protein [Anaerolineaceae bacterium]|nr:helicase-associated domain-containing protein [Anaerolineaceae bacterium]